MRHACLLLPLLLSSLSLNANPIMSAFVVQGEAKDRGLASLDGGTLRLETLGPCEWPWDLQVAAPLTESLQAGERLTVGFSARARKSQLPSKEALLQVVVEESKDPWTKSTETALRAGPDWTPLTVSLESKGSYAAGGAQLVLRLGYTPQVLEIKDLKVVKAPGASTPQSYPGREEGAAWRKEALKRIEGLRMGGIKVSVVDAAGKPVEGAQVAVKMAKSAFRWGSAVSAKQLFLVEGSQDTLRYEQSIPKYFNMTTEENSLKWKAITGDLGKDYGLHLGMTHAAWASSRGLDFRGHALLWPGWRNSPKLAEELKDKPEELRKAIHAHVSATVAAMKGRLVDWDVINEPWDNQDIMKALGGDAILAECFRIAKQQDPEAKLFINDYAILEGGGGESNHRIRYEKVIRELIAAGAPLEGIGIQGHFSAPLTAPVDMQQLLDRFAAFGKPLLITEYDIEGDDWQLSADFLRDLLILCYAHPAMEGFIMWGFWDGKHWKKNAPLFFKDWSPKPALKVWEDLVMKEWKTEASGVTDKKGAALIQGHLGDYEVSVSKGASQAQGQVKLVKAGSQLQLVLP